MLSPSKVVRWECGLCTYTIKDPMRRDFLAYQTRHLVRYAIVAVS
jgi:hypothetical protein